MPLTEIVRHDNEDILTFIKRMGLKEYFYNMFLFDYIICNRDRHGANIEVLRSGRKHTIRIAPLFDHGLSFLCSCYSDEEIEKFDILDDKPCQNFIGSRSTFENLSYITNKNTIFKSKLKPQDKEILFSDLSSVLSETHLKKIWDMLWARWCVYEKLCNL